jgi:hypothetical protein
MSNQSSTIASSMQVISKRTSLPSHPAPSHTPPREGEGVFVSAYGNKERREYHEPPPKDDDADPVNVKVKFKTPDAYSNTGQS